MATRRTCALLALFLVAALPAWVRARVAGGGPARSDCYVEFDGVSGKGSKVDCTDGDPSCDQDGTCNGVCTLRVTLCAAQADLPRCQPPTVTAITVRKGPALQLPVLPATAPTCGPANTIAVPLRKGGKKPGKLTLQVVASAVAKPPKDTDTLVLRCLPNRSPASCLTPPTTSTTTSSTTTVPSITTTTTSTTLPPRLATVTIGSPAAFALLTTTPVAVSGTVTGAATVRCNGVEAVVAGGAFTATVPLGPQDTVITCLGAGEDGRVVSDSVNVTLDNVAPRVVIEAPAAGLITDAERVDVNGVVDDPLAEIGSPLPRVRVNGVEAGVAQHAFLVTGLPLSPGDNAITAIATDRAGNTSSVSLHVTRQALAGQRLRLVSGNGQTAAAGAELSTPLVVEVLDAQGSPVVGRLVSFAVARGSGTLAAGAERGRTVTLASDAQGRATARWTLGANAGQGSDRVTASAVGFVGQPTFCASATTGTADRIVALAGDHQTGATGERLPYPLVAAVLDAAGNPVVGAPVRFAVVDGGGVVGDQTSLDTATGPDGKAGVTFRLGPVAGVNAHRVEATLTGTSAPPAVFTANAMVAGAAVDTSMSGVVLDDGERPVPGVTAQIAGTGLEAVADADGYFIIRGAPVGPIRLWIRGHTATRPGLWPDLEFMPVTVAGQDNTVGAPIRLPELDPATARTIGGDTDVTLDLPGVPGFGLTVFAHSVTFPGGARTGLLGVTQVHFDKVPMPPPNGAPFTVAWTFQPPGVRFAPPARLTVPNTGLPPGQQADMFWFDHDLGIFVSIGSGTVSADGAVITSNPGFGVAKTGWGGATPPPPPPRCTASCRTKAPCKRTVACKGGGCRLDDQPRCTACTAGGKPGQCDGAGACVPFMAGPMPKAELFTDGVDCKGSKTLAITKKMTLQALDVEDMDEAIQGCPQKPDSVSPSHIKWTVSAGTPKSGVGRRLQWTAPDEPATVTVTLEIDDDGAVADDGGFVKADEKQVAVVIPNQDTSTVARRFTCPPGQFGGGDSYSGRVDYEGCGIDFSGLKVREKEGGPTNPVTCANGHSETTPNSTGGPWLAIDGSNRYGFDDVVRWCAGRDPVIPTGGCAFRNQTTWLISPKSLPYITHTNTLNWPAGDATSMPPGGVSAVTTSRVP